MWQKDTRILNALWNGRRLVDRRIKRQEDASGWKIGGWAGDGQGGVTASKI